MADSNNQQILKLADVRARREEALIPEDVADRRVARRMRVAAFVFGMALGIFLVVYAVIAGDANALYAAIPTLGAGFVALLRHRRGGGQSR